MLIVPTHPEFLETMVRFVITFVPTLTIHRVHIGERTEEILSLQIEMEDGSIMFVEAQYWLDRIQLVLEYGWQRVDVWMYANFPTGSNDTLPNAPSSLSVQHSMVVQEERESRLEMDGADEIAVNGIFAQDIDKYLLEFGRETRFTDGSFGDLLGHRHLSRMERETVLRSVQTDVIEEVNFIFNRNIGKDGAFKQCEFPEPCSRFEHPVLRPSTVDGKLEQSL